ncbi:MAG: phytanoyl-CoA dioxygenase family protein [Pseudomonadota bacterium]
MVRKLKQFANVLFGIVLLPTSSKSFLDNPVLGNQLLNKMGLYIIRAVIAHGVFHLKLLCLSPFLDASMRKQYKSQGFIQYSDFLPEDQFNALEQEVRAYSGDAWQNTQGDTVTQRVFLNYQNVKSLPACRQLMLSADYLKPLKYTSAKNESPRFYIQQIQNERVSSRKKDPQKTFHMDTFHPTMKAWLFLEDVTLENGPFTYVPGSNRLTWKRIKWLYNQSVVGKNLDNKYSRKGSLRITEDELETLGYAEPKQFVVPKNTLVIGNTFGFHCRGAVTRANASRLEIWAISRVNPFNPFPGINCKWLSDARDWVYTSFEEREHATAQARQQTATWNKVSNARFKNN